MRNEKELFWLSYQPIVLIPSATITQSVGTDGDAPFQMDAIMGYAVDNATNTQRNFLIKLRDDTTSKDLTSNATFSKLVCTNAEALNPLPVSRQFAEKTTVTLTVTNPSAADTITVYISLRGYKRFDLVLKK